MGRTSGELDNWIVPKRCNVYQTLALLAVLEKYPVYCNFTAANQTNVATKMRLDYGASKARTVQAQSARTTKAMAEYMGFVKSDGNQIEITAVGQRFLNNHRAELINKGHTLLKPIAPLISEAEEWKEQMIKLQLINPSQPKCEDIYIYPFRFVLKLLLQKSYLDTEELAMFVLTATKDSDLTKVSKEIDKFRSKKYVYREKQVEKFKSTKFGNIALKQASSATYFMSICEATGLIERIKLPIMNSGAKRKIRAMAIKPSKVAEVNRIITTYGVKKCLKFSHDERKMWDYYYCGDGIAYPVEIEISNRTKTNILVQVENLTKAVDNDQEILISPKMRDVLYAMPGWGYVAHIYDFTDTIPSANINFGANSGKLMVNKSMLSAGAILTKKELVREIRELISKKGVTDRIKKQLDMYALLTGSVISNMKIYRGAYLELYFSMLFDILKSKRIIDDYKASVIVNKYNIPHAIGNHADFVISVGNVNTVLEITLLRPAKSKISKDMKMEVEGAVRHMKEQRELIDSPTGKKSLGIFSPAANNSILSNELDRWSIHYGVKNKKTITLNDLINVLERENKSEIQTLFS